MARNQLGRTGLEIPGLTLGTWVFAGDQIWGPQDLKDSISTIHAALDMGLNLFDSAPGYGAGRSEEILGEALEGRRDKAIIATKVSPTDLDGEGVRKSCEDSLRRLRTDRIDLLQVHWPSRTVPFVETVEAFNGLKEAGKIRYAGVCNFGAPDVEEWISAGGEIVSNQLSYSLLSRAIEYEIIPACKRHGISVLPYSPLLQGLLTGKFRTADEVPETRARTRHFSGDRPSSRHGETGCEDLTFSTIASIRAIGEREGIPMGRLALAWLVAQDIVASTIVGARNVEQLKDNKASLDLVISDEVVDELEPTARGSGGYGSTGV